jgi:hypothetical protein
MIPYFAVNNVDRALFNSIGVTCVVLLIFGYCKAITTGTTNNEALYGAMEALAIEGEGGGGCGCELLDCEVVNQGLCGIMWNMGMESL